MRKGLVARVVPLAAATFAAIPWPGIASGEVDGAVSVAPDRTLRSEVVVEAPIERVWAAFTTEEGIESWMVPVTSIDLRVGGEWRTSYNPSSNLRDADTIVHTILAYEPMRMLATRTTPPESAARLFGGVDFSRLWSVYRFEPIDAGSTRVTVSGMGYGEGEAWDRVYTFFEQNNPVVLQELARHLEGRTDGEPAEDATERIMALLHRWVGGEWIHENSAREGEVFRVRNVVTAGPDGVSLLCQGWLGNAAGMTPHALSIIRRGSGGVVRFENVNERGSVARGRIRLQGEGTLVWDWSEMGLNGATARYIVTTTFGEDPDIYAMTVGRIVPDEGGGERLNPMVDLSMRRVPRAPEAFLRMAPARTPTGRPGQDR